MGIQLTVKAAVMSAANWDSVDVTIEPGYWDTYDLDNYGEEPKWVPPVIYRKWVHPEHGELWAYAVSNGDFYIDCNAWGSNRAHCINAGLFELQHILA